MWRSLLRAGPASTRTPPIRVKDRQWFPGAIADKPNWAVLVDAAALTPQAVTPLLEQIDGNVCLTRYFTVEESPEWAACRAAKNWSLFQVDSFMPIHMQILADVSHIMDHRKVNGATRACLMVPADHGAAYARAFSPCARNGGWSWMVMTPLGVSGEGVVENER